MKKNTDKSLILFDGYCNLCDRSVQFLLKRDFKKQFVFSSLQSDAAQQILLHFNFKKETTDSIILIEKGKLYDRSTAVLRIVRHLGPFWKYSYHLHKIPKSFRDRIYDLIARNRYQWFGNKEFCTEKPAGYKDRFL